MFDLLKVESLAAFDQSLMWISIDRGYDCAKTSELLNERGIFEHDIQLRGTEPEPGTPHRLTLGLRWMVDATNTW